MKKLTKVNPEAGHSCFVEGKARFGTVPSNEFIDGMPIFTL